MRYYIIAGEASGDLHASNMMKELALYDTDADYRCWGGDMMQKNGGKLVKHYKDLAFMGFMEVLLNLRTIFKNLNFCEQDIIAYNPDALILVDYPGFNLRIARFAHEHNIRVFYYISPQVWAWKQSRVHTIKKVVDKMFVILPFEKEFYARFNHEVFFVGHPLLDAIENNETLVNKSILFETHQLDDRPLVALLPGSRMQEIQKMLSVMLKAISSYKEFQFVVCAVNSIDKEIYKEFCAGYDVKIVFNDTYNVLNNAYAALVTSGTATLEAALFNVPQVVCYDANIVSYIIAKNLVKLEFISLVNLIMEKEVVTELIQKDLNVDRLKKEFDDITKNEDKRNRIFDDYADLRSRLGGSGASKKIAAIIYEDMMKKVK